MKKAGLSGGDDRRSLTETLNEMESVLSRKKTTAPNLAQPSKAKCNDCHTKLFTEKMVPNLGLPSHRSRIVGRSRREYIP